MSEKEDTSSTTCVFYARVQDLNRIAIPTEIADNILRLKKGNSVEMSVRKIKRRDLM